MAESLVAIVTGGAEGIGAAIVEALLKIGYKVCAADVNKDKVEKFVKEMQEVYGVTNVAFIECDVAKEDDLRRVFDFTLQTFSRIDAVFNNAGISDRGVPVQKVVGVNLIGPIIGCHLAIEYLGKSRGGKGGVVVNTASRAGLRPYPRSPIYAATKYGVVGLTRSYGTPDYLEKEGVVFTALCPAFTDTSLVQSLRGIASADIFNNLLTPEYVAQGALKLLNDRINGSVLTVTNQRGYEYVNFPEQ